MPTSALFLICVLVWGTTWYAIVWQLHVLAPVAAVALRFALAAAALFGWCAWRGLPVRFGGGAQRLFAMQGLLGFALSYGCVYAAEQRVVSGLVAVGYAGSPLVGLLLARWILGSPMSARVALGGVAGVAGVAMIFGHEFERLSAAPGVLAGALLTALGVFTSSLSNMAVALYQRRGIAGPAPLAWAMAWGAAPMALLAAFSPEPQWLAPPDARFLASLTYLVLAGSVLTFLCFNALLGRIGPARAGYVGVATPVVALIFSTLFEGFEPSTWTWLGVALVVAGNAVALWPKRAAAARA